MVSELSAEKLRGAFFTPEEIATYLAQWAVDENPSAAVLDPTAGDGAFLVAAASELHRLGASPDQLAAQVVGVELDGDTISVAAARLRERGLDARLIRENFFRLTPPIELFPSLGMFDAVVGNPPFIRYQHHAGESRRLSLAAALKQSVRLNGLASSWPAVLVHATAFLKPKGKLAMVLPAEALSVGYAEPVRQWLRRRFAEVRLVMFERLQFQGTQEDVVLLLAEGTGGSDAFALYQIGDAKELKSVRPFRERPVALSNRGKWTDLVLTGQQRTLFRELTGTHFQQLERLAVPSLGTVTGANSFFVISESTRLRFALRLGKDVCPVYPLGTRAPSGLVYRERDWRQQRDSGSPVWLLDPDPSDLSQGLRAYIEVGEQLGIPQNYKCRTRPIWWKPPVVAPPDLLFTYMSHQFPRIVENRSKATILNSMHGLKLRGEAGQTRRALPLMALNSVTQLGAEINGRAYGGGVLKMEPREAARLPVPSNDLLLEGWGLLAAEWASLETRLLKGLWTSVVARVDEALLKGVLGLPRDDVEALQDAVQLMRTRRLSRKSSDRHIG